MNYYFMTDDKVNRDYNFSVTDGCVDFIIRKAPFEDKKDEEAYMYTYEYEYGPDSPDTRYYNSVSQKSAERIDFSYDLYSAGPYYYLSEKFLNVLKQFRLSDYIFPRLVFTVSGRLIDSPKFYCFRLVPFVYSGVRPPDFLDYAKTEQLPSRTSNIVSRKIVLKNDIPLDFFALTKIELLSSQGFVVSEDMKNALEKTGCDKGLLFLPIETAQEEYCKHTFKDFNDLIKRKKPRIPGMHY